MQITNIDIISAAPKGLGSRPGHVHRVIYRTDRSHNYQLVNATCAVSSDCGLFGIGSASKLGIGGEYSVERRSVDSALSL